MCTHPIILIRYTSYLIIVLIGTMHGNEEIAALDPTKPTVVLEEDIHRFILRTLR